MTDPHSTIPDHAKPAFWRRYEDWRMTRYEKSLAKNAHRYPKLRNQKSFRRLVVAQGVTHVVTVASAVIAFFDDVLFLIPFVVGLGGSVIVMCILRIVTGSIADAPQGALDEIQLAQRNSARSIGYFAVFSLAFIPYFVLIFMGSAMDYVKGQNVYGIGVLLVAVVYIGASVPTMLTSWWMADPDPEDYAEESTGFREARAIDEPLVPAAEPPAARASAASERGQSTHDDPPTPATW